MPPLEQPRPRNDQTDAPELSEAGCIVRVADEQSSLDVDERLVQQAVLAVLADAGVESAEISVALVDNPTIHAINRDYLSHDYPTDVLSFPLSEGGPLAGEVIISTDTAIQNAAEYQRPPLEEALLYVVHGTLHLVGYDDKSSETQSEMRRAESRVLQRLAAEEPPAA